MLSRFTSLVVLLVGLLVLPATASAQDRSAFSLTLSCRALPLVVDGLLQSHVTEPKENDALVRRVAKIYAERMDSTETLLTEAEYEALEKRIRKLARAIRKGDCEDFDKLKKDQIAWQQDLESHVKKIVTESFEIDKKRELDLDPEKRPRPQNDKEQAELRRALIDFQMANYLASGTEKKEAREKLIHRYELFTKRVSEQTEEDLYGTYLNAYASALDPHSSYMSPDEVANFRIQMELSLTGIGAVLSSQDGYTTIEEIVPGGAADRNGKLKTKDQIIAVAQGPKADPVDVIDMNLNDVVKMIRGKKDSKVTLTVLRKKPDSTERMEITIVRDKIDLKEQAAKLKWREIKRGEKTQRIAIIDLPSFYMGDKPGERDSAQDVARLLAQAKKEGADGVLLDLSRNGGGALQSSVLIGGLFIEEGAVVGVGEKGTKMPRVLEDPDSGVLWDGPLVVLTSKISASASEILAGMLQDYNRAVVVGDEHTFGKGSVQQLSQLPPGLGLLKVTTALFYLPGGDSTQSIGVPSDVVVPSPFSHLDIGERHQKYALQPMSTNRFVSGNANQKKSWKPIDKKTVKELAAASAKRIAESKDFKELADEQKKNGDSTKIKISDILGEGDGDESEDEEKDDKDKLSIQTEEATEIVADLVQAQK